MNFIYKILSSANSDMIVVLCQLNILLTVVVCLVYPENDFKLPIFKNHRKLEYIFIVMLFLLMILTMICLVYLIRSIK